MRNLSGYSTIRELARKGTRYPLPGVALNSNKCSRYFAIAVSEWPDWRKFEVSERGLCASLCP